MFQVTRKTHEAIQNARKFGIERFNLNVEELQGCFFKLSLAELVDEEGFVDQKLATLANRRISNISVDAARLQAATYDLAEIQLCLGLFAIASDLPDVFDVTDDTTAEDIYLQLAEHSDLLSGNSKGLFSAAENSISASGIFGTVVNGVVAANRAAFNVGVGLTRFVRKHSKKGLNRFGNWLANNTSDKKEVTE
jgi:hypothetical protein